MSREVNAQGTYRVKETGEDISYSFTYQAIDSVADAIETLGEDKTKSLLQRMLKVDANNVAREKAKVENGHSTRQPMTEEQKAERKAQRGADRDLLKLLKDKGLSLEDIKNM